MSLDGGLVALAVVVGELLAGEDVARGHEYDVRPGGRLEQLGLAIAAELGVIEQAAETARLRRGVDAQLLRLVLEEVHVAADGRVLGVGLLASFRRRVRHHLASVLAHEVAATKGARREHRPTLVGQHANLQALLISTAFDRLFNNIQLYFNTLTLKERKNFAC